MQKSKRNKFSFRTIYIIGISDDGTSNTFEEDDPAKEKEAEIMLEYIEKFTELMEDEKYEEAAVHAANSPKGILRTVETMQKFKGRCYFSYCRFNFTVHSCSRELATYVCNINYIIILFLTDICIAAFTMTQTNFLYLQMS